MIVSIVSKNKNESRKCVFNNGLTIGENLSSDYFVPKDPERYHPAEKGIPITFKYLRNNVASQNIENQILVSVNHFPIHDTIIVLP
ncbi:MAG: hypothetical protein E6K94_00865 [Thaumarchaeota archaeon]|nr:MAG: hypothetical protein E6K94_00865 [Nitrososphaerota archaeon]